MIAVLPSPCSVRALLNAHSGRTPPASEARIATANVVGGQVSGRRGSLAIYEPMPRSQTKTWRRYLDACQGLDEVERETRPTAPTAERSISVSPLSDGARRKYSPSLSGLLRGNLFVRAF